MFKGAVQFCLFFKEFLFCVNYPLVNIIFCGYRHHATDAVKRTVMNLKFKYYMATEILQHQAEVVYHTAEHDFLCVCACN